MFLIILLNYLTQFKMFNIKIVFNENLCSINIHLPVSVLFDYSVNYLPRDLLLWPIIGYLPLQLSSNFYTSGLLFESNYAIY